MSTFTFLTFAFIVVGLPMICLTWGGFMRQKMKLRERELEIMTAQTAERAAQYAANGADLAQRVQVLERIVTDRGLDLTTEIERLRDLPAPAPVPAPTPAGARNS